MLQSVEGKCRQFSVGLRSVLRSRFVPLPDVFMSRRMKSVLSHAQQLYFKN